MPFFQKEREEWKGENILEGGLGVNKPGCVDGVVSATQEQIKDLASKMTWCQGQRNDGTLHDGEPKGIM